MIKELDRNLDEFVGEKARIKVLEGSEKLASVSESRQIAMWVQEAMERLDKFVDEKTRIRVMEECGRSCAEANSKTIEKVKAKRNKYKSTDARPRAQEARILGQHLEDRGGGQAQPIVSGREVLGDHDGRVVRGKLPRDLPV